MDPVVVLVPDERGLREFDGSALVRPVVYDVDGRVPAAGRAAEVLVAHGLDPARSGEIFAQLPNLRMVQLFSSGSDEWEAVIPAGIRLSNADRAHGGIVAEWAVAQLLSHYRRLDAYRARQREERWEAVSSGTLSGADALVFGAGDIGDNLRRRLEPFGTVVTSVGRTARGTVLDFPGALARLAEFDIVVLAVPLTAQTRGMVDAQFLAAMRDGAVLVNVGRGPLVDTDALVTELRARRLYALLDVTDPEPLPPGHPLWNAPGAVVTPHIAGTTAGTLDRCWAAVVRKVTEYAHRRDTEGRR